VKFDIRNRDTSFNKRAALNAAFCIDRENLSELCERCSMSSFS
jgi:hypothetical protein